MSLLGSYTGFAEEAVSQQSRAKSRAKSRATGKTFRAILSALLEASKGKQVNFVAKSEYDADSKYVLARRIMDEYFKGNSEQFYPADPFAREIRFPNAGAVIFKSIPSQYVSYAPIEINDTE